MSTVQLPPLPSWAFGDLMEALPVAAAVCGADGRILRVNSALMAYIGQSAESWVGKAFADLPLAPVSGPDDDAELYVATSCGLPSTRLKRTRLTVAGEGPSSVAIHLLEVYKPLDSDELHPLAAIGGRPQGIDRESGVLDRTSLAHVLHSEVTRCRRYGNPLAVVVLDLLHASGGTLACPESLSAVAIVGQMLADQTRWADSVGRWDPMRFVLVLPETPLESAERLASKIQKSIRGLAVDDVHLEIALAVDAWQKGDDARSLMTRAERLLAPVDARPVKLVLANDRPGHALHV